MSIVYYLLNVIDIFLNFLLYTHYFVKKKWVSFIKLTLVAVVLTLARAVINESTLSISNLLNFLYSIISIFLLCFLCFQAPLKLRILYTSFFAFLWVCLDTVIPLGISLVFKVNIMDIMKETDLKVYVFFLFLFFKFIMIQYIRKRKKQFILKREGKLHRIQLMIPIISCFSIIYISMPEISANGYNFLRTNMMILVLVMINIIQFYVLEQLNRLQSEKIENMKIEEIYKYKDSYYQQVEKHQQEIRTIKHDLKHQFMVIKTYLDKKNYQMAEQEIAAILQDILTIEEYSFTRNQVVNAFLNAKIKQAQEADIDCDVSVKLPEEMNLSDRDMVVLLGNMLDNCIEACIRVEGERKLSLNIFYYNSAVLIQSSNTTDGHVIGLVTRKNSKLKHGLGLRSIQTIIDKYNGSMKISIAQDMFCTEIFMWDIKSDE